MVIEERRISFVELLAERQVSSDMYGRLATKAIVVLPLPPHTAHAKPLFPANTRSVFLRLAKELNDACDVAVQETEYRELVQHADLWVLPAMYCIDPAAANVAINVLSNYIYDRLRGLLPGGSAEVDSEVIIATESAMMNMRYKGPAPTFERSLRDALRSIRKE